METMYFWRRAMAVAILLVAGVHMLDLAVKTAPLPGAASRFFTYFEALEETGQVDVWERLVYSWMLAGGQENPDPSS